MKGLRPIPKTKEEATAQSRARYTKEQRDSIDKMNRIIDRIQGEKVRIRNSRDEEKMLKQQVSSIQIPKPPRP
jgi:hypothetical protein